MEQTKIDRINELARKSKAIGLSATEKAEQQALRKEYIEAFRGNLKTTLDSIIVVDRDGNRQPLKKKTDP